MFLKIKGLINIGNHPHSNILDYHQFEEISSNKESFKLWTISAKKLFIDFSKTLKKS